MRIDPFSHTEFEHIIHDEVGSALVKFAEPLVGADGHIGLEPGVSGQSKIPYSEFVGHLGNGFALSFELDGAFEGSGNTGAGNHELHIKTGVDTGDAGGRGVRQHRVGVEPFHRRIVRVAQFDKSQSADLDDLLIPPGRSDLQFQAFACFFWGNSQDHSDFFPFSCLQAQGGGFGYFAGDSLPGDLPVGGGGEPGTESAF